LASYTALNIQVARSLMS